MLCTILAAAAIVAYAPDEPKVKVDVAAPKAVVKDGLSLTARPAKAKFARDEALAFRFEFGNQTREPLRLRNQAFGLEYNDGASFDRCIELTITDTKTNQTRRVRCTAEISRLRIGKTTVTIEPGKTHAFAFQFERFLMFVAEGGKPEEGLPAGRYRLTAEWIFSAEPNSTAKFWTGRITAEPVEFTVGE